MRQRGLGSSARKVCLGTLVLVLAACGRSDFWTTTFPVDAGVESQGGGVPTPDSGPTACVPTNVCNLGAVAAPSAPSGRTTCLDTGTPNTAANGLYCAPRMVCSDGRCQTCAAGDPCAVGDCQLGLISCTSGTAVCESLGTGGASPDWSTCGDGGYCSAGACVLFQPASHPDFPQIPDQGGTVLAAPALVTVTFRDVPFRSDVEAFGSWIVGSSWLKTVGEGYGVGLGPSARAVSLDQDAPDMVSSPGEIEAILDKGISSGSLPSPDAQTIYLLYFPAHTQLAFGGCASFSGYHFWFGSSSGATVVYGVILDCEGGGVGLIESIASHELIEAATDPHPNGTGPPTTYQITDNLSAWADSVGGEVGDLCVFEDQRDPASGFTVQSIWSNSAAAAGDRSPCVPSSGAPYFAVSASPAEPQTLVAGSSIDFTVTGWSNRPMPPWPISLVGGGDFDAHPSLSAFSVANGGTLILNLTVPANAPSGAKGWALIESSNAAGQVESFWPVVVFAL